MKRRLGLSLIAAVIASVVLAVLCDRYLVWHHIPTPGMIIVAGHYSTARSQASCCNLTPILYVVMFDAICWLVLIGVFYTVALLVCKARPESRQATRTKGDKPTYFKSREDDDGQ